MANRLRTKYDESVFAALKEKFNYSNAMEVPKLEKITINMGLGEAKSDDSQSRFAPCKTLQKSRRERKGARTPTRNSPTTAF